MIHPAYGQPGRKGVTSPLFHPRRKDSTMPYITPRQAALIYGMSETLADRYLTCIAERDDYLEWADNPQADWVIDSVDFPDGAEHVLDTEYGRTGWHLCGTMVYDEEPDCAVGIGPVAPGRFVPTGEVR